MYPRCGDVEYTGPPHIDLDSQPSSAVQLSALERMNDDAIKYLLDFLTPGALRSLVLTNRKMMSLALPRLYHSLNLYMDGPQLRRSLGLLKSLNPGLKFVRRVVITPARDDWDTNSDIIKFVEKLLEAIPAYRLQYFR